MRSEVDMDRHQKQNQLPAIVDNKNTLHQGHFSTSTQDTGRRALLLTDEMRCAKGRLEDESGELIVDDELLSSHGWLDPSGSLYPCGFKRHDHLASRLGFTHASEIERSGFVKLANLNWLIGGRWGTGELTEAQWETIERWYERNRFPKEHYLKLCATVG